ncbi:MAG: BlaI/MecI/CopY family transcriptional regulator [Planctomycetota bacterium]
MPPPSRRDVTDAELSVLRHLWQNGPATIRELTDRLYPGGSTSAYATVQKLLDRLEAKACVHRTRTQVPHVFAAAIEREALIAQRLEALADSLCEGSLAPLLTNLVGRQRLSEEERRALRSLVDDLDRRKEPKARRKDREP